MPGSPIYLDNNATTACDPRVVAEMLPYFTEVYGNAASRTHSFGWAAEEAASLARERVASLIGAEAQEIVFTSGATEAVNLALKGVFERYASKGRHLITCVTEHKAVLDTCHHIEKNGGRVTYLPVDHRGSIDPVQLEAALTTDTILVSVMYANNETGTIHPIREIASIAKKHGVLFFCDATQAVGKIPVSVTDDGIDLLALSAHKMYGPKGAGALYVRRKNPRVSLTAQMDGGGHERNMRSGTLNVPGIVGLGKAAELCRLEVPQLSPLRDHLEAALLSIPHTVINGNPASRLPHVTNLSFQNIDSQQLLISLAKEIALSSGSACTSANPEPSYVLKAMGLPDALARASLRFSLGRFNTLEEIDQVITLVTDAVTRLRR